tara:strand:- start:1886 stop:2005 length:120 start_codon:yes stop_codon:yes gene_type:complete
MTDELYISTIYEYVYNWGMTEEQAQNKLNAELAENLENE